MAYSLLAATLAQALIPAIFGFLGVIVGSALTWMREARRQRGETLAAARLIGAELAEMSKKLETRLPSAAQDRSALAAELTTPSWDELRSELALGLNPKQWGDVREAFARVAALRLALANEGSDMRDIGDRAVDARDHIESAQKALAALEPREWRRAVPRRPGN